MNQSDVIRFQCIGLFLLANGMRIGPVEGQKTFRDVVWLAEDAQEYYLDQSEEERETLNNGAVAYALESISN